MKNSFTKILFVILTAVGMLGFSGQARAVDPLVVQFQGDSPPLFKEANFAPGSSVTRWVKVTNNSGQSQRIATEAINKSDSDNFGSKLNLVIKEGATEIFNNTLKKFFDQGETYLSDLADSSTAQYDFTISFNSDTDNFYQGKTLGFDIVVGFEGTEGGLPLPSPGGGSGGGGGGGGLPPGLTIYNEATEVIGTVNVTLTWTTSYAATSQVLYAADGEIIDGRSHTLNLADNVGTPPRYGYAYTTLETDISPKVTSHSVTISGLIPGTTYYYRAVSHASLAISGEHTFTTLAEGETGIKPEEGVIARAFKTPSPTPGQAGAASGPGTGGSPSPTVSLGGILTLSPSPFAKAGQANLLAAIGNILSLGTNKIWLGILVILVIIFLIYLLLKRRRQKQPLP